MGQHPELRENTDLSPEPFAPHLMRQAEIKKLQAEQDKKKAERDSAQAATSAPVFLFHGMDVGGRPTHSLVPLRPRRAKTLLVDWFALSPASCDPQATGLKIVRELAERQPIIVVDTREQTPLRFQRLEAVPGTLATGDYSIAGLEHLFSVERKTVADLVGCCTGENRARFQRESCSVCAAISLSASWSLAVSRTFARKSILAASNRSQCWRPCTPLKFASTFQSCLHRRLRPRPAR